MWNFWFKGLNSNPINGNPDRNHNLENISSTYIYLEIELSLVKFRSKSTLAITFQAYVKILTRNNTYAGWNSKKADNFTQVLHDDNSNVVLNELNTLIDNINTDSVTPD